MSVTLKDIAEHLNISVSTVSRVVNNKDRVDPQTRKRVLNALEEFQYRPNEVARSLKRKTSKAIGIVVPDISNVFFSTVIKGVESVARQYGYSVIVCNSDESREIEDEYTDLLLQKQVSALIIATVGGNMDFFKLYKRAGVPVVFIDNIPKMDSNFDFVAIDNIKASYKLVEHLVKLGHKEIAIITGSLNETTALERLQGWENCLKDNNITIRKEWIATGDFKQQSGYNSMQRLLNGRKVPTAVFAANNFLSYGAIRAILDANLRIPEDIALVGFDAVDLTGLVRPRITSVIQPAEEIGVIAGEIIMRKINNNKTAVFEKVILEPQLVIKESCGYQLRKELK
jgi:DNA-binding LacI/PurR family transcriptional regulator